MKEEPGAIPGDTKRSRNKTLQKTALKYTEAVETHREAMGGCHWSVLKASLLLSVPKDCTEHFFLSLATLPVSDLRSETAHFLEQRVLAIDVRLNKYGTSATLTRVSTPVVVYSKFISRQADGIETLCIARMNLTGCIRWV